MRSTPAARAAGSGPDEHAVAPMNTAMGRMPLRLLCMVFPFRFFRVSTEAIPVTTGAQVRRSVASRLREAKSFAEGMAGEGSATKERRGPAGPRVTNRAGPSGLAPDDWCLKNTSHLGPDDLKVAGEQIRRPLRHRGRTGVRVDRVELAAEDVLVVRRVGEVRIHPADVVRRQRAGALVRRDQVLEALRVLRGRVGRDRE